MKRFIKNTKFKTKIILLFLTLLLLHSTIAGTLYYKYTYKDTLSNYYQSSEDTIYQLNVHMYSRFRSIAKSVNALSNNMSFANPMSVFLRNPDTLNYAKLMGDVADSITEMQMSDDYIHSIYIYTKYGDFDNFVRIKKHGIKFEETEVYQYFEEHPDETVAWFPAMENPVFIGTDIVIPIVYKFAIGRENIFILINLDQSKINDYLNETYNSYEKIFIVDKNGKNIINFDDKYKEIPLIRHQEDDLDEMALCQPLKIGEDDYLVTSTMMKGNSWEIYALKSTESLLGNLTSLRKFISLELSISALLALFIIILCVRSLTAPLGRLVNIMDKTIKEGFHIKFHYPYKDEVGNLAKSFNYMVEEIEDLVTELNLHIEALKEEKEALKVVQEQKRIAEIKALQAQINPHFLYNTLNTITWQAADQGAKEISILSKSLGSFFRIALSKGREIITIREELEHVKSYLEIQKIRYKSKVNYSIEIDDEIKDCSIIKILLQPLVENAIYHGIKTKEGHGNISITAVMKMDELTIPAIKLCVEDDGLGIEKDQLEILNDGLSKGIVDSKNGYGIYNVNQRLKLTYGEIYGLSLESKLGEWTRAIIIIPVQKLD